MSAAFFVLFFYVIFLLAKSRKKLKMANRYKIPNLNVNAEKLKLQLAMTNKKSYNVDIYG